MKKIFSIALVMMALVVSSCTDNQRARMYGGTMKVELPKGQRLVEATWKNHNLWYLTEPMDSDYIPKIKTFKEDSNFGIVEGDVIFIETK